MIIDNYYAKFRYHIYMNDPDILLNQRAFRWLCKNGKLDAAQYMFNKNPNVNSNSDAQEQNLEDVCKNGHYDVFWWLMSINSYIMDDDIDYLLNIACEYGHDEIAFELYKRYPNIAYDYEEIFESSCLNGHVDIAKWLIKCMGETNFNATSISKNFNMFINTCEYGHVAILKLLVDTFYIETNVRNNRAFVVACTHGQLNAARWLYNKNSNVYDTSNDIHNVLNLACTDASASNNAYSVNIIKWLLSIDTQNKINITHVFDTACIHGNERAINYLLDNSSSIVPTSKNFINICERCSLILAIKFITKNKEIIKEIVNNKKKLKNAFSIACLNNVELATFLYAFIDNISDSTIQNHFYIACCNEKFKVAKWLVHAHPFIDITQEVIATICYSNNPNFCKWMESVNPNCLSTFNIGILRKLHYDCKYKTIKYLCDTYPDVYLSKIYMYNDVVNHFMLKSLKNYLDENNLDFIYDAKNVKINKINTFVQDECNICFENNSTILTNCNHHYCDVCFINYFLLHCSDSCAKCRNCLMENYQITISKAT